MCNSNLSFFVILISTTLMGCGQTDPLLESSPPKLPHRNFTKKKTLPTDFDTGQEATIVPGQSAGLVSLGMSKSAVMKLLGTKGKVRSYKEEYNNYKNMEYTPKKELVFFAGFDESVQFSHQSKKHKVPLYKAFFKDDKLCYMILTTYSGFRASPKDFMIEGVQAFGQSKNLLNHMGKYYYRSARGYDGEYYWLTKGMEATVEKGKVTVIDIFTPLSPLKAIEYKAIVGENS